MASCTSPQHLEFLDNAFMKIQNMGFKTSKMDHIALQYWYNSFLGLSGSMEKDFLSESQPWKLVCVASVSVRFRSKERGTRVKDRRIKTENTLPQSLFAPKPNGNACYTGYKKVQRMNSSGKKDEHVIITTTYPAAGYVSIHKLLTGFTFSGYFHFLLSVVK